MSFCQGFSCSKRHFAPSSLYRQYPSWENLQILLRLFLEILQPLLGDFCFVRIAFVFFCCSFTFISLFSSSPKSVVPPVLRLFPIFFGYFLSLELRSVGSWTNIILFLGLVSSVRSFTLLILWGIIWPWRRSPFFLPPLLHSSPRMMSTVPTCSLMRAYELRNSRLFRCIWAVDRRK